ncbi:MAG: dolichyl-phosphate beta-glucosyltransferase [Verrucomicrobiota bacterium]
MRTRSVFLNSRFLVPPVLSIVIPAWNEEKRLPPALHLLDTFRRTLPFESEVIVVVEPGTDATLAHARAFASAHPGFEILGTPVHRGKGHAVQTGMRHARGDLLFYMDADLSVPLPEILAFLDYFKAHPEVAILVGNRAHAKSRITRRQAFLRRTMGDVFNRILQGWGLVSLHDTQCGFKAFRREAAQAIFARQTVDGFAFDVELLLIARRLGYTIADLPVEWLNSPESKVHILRDSARMLLDAWRMRG